MSDYADFNEKARRALREATALSKRLIAESKQIQAECDDLVLDSLIVMFRSDALVCASKMERRGRDAERFGWSREYFDTFKIRGELVGNEPQESAAQRWRWRCERRERMPIPHQ